MPEDDVSDLRDVVDAINKLCETMKTSYDEYQDCEDVEENDSVDTEFVDSNIVVVDDVGVHVAEFAEYWSDTDFIVSQEIVVVKPVPEKIETYIDTVTEPFVSAAVVVSEPVIFATCKADRLRDTVVEPVSYETTVESILQLEHIDSWSEAVNETVVSEPIFEKVKTYKSERKSERTEHQRPLTAKADTEFRSIATDRFEDIEPTASDVEAVQCELSEMYYTASSEVSLVSDVDFQERAQIEDSDREKDDRTGVMAGHVAAMRERFESMTRTNTPCPDVMRSISPSFELFRNISASPDRLE